MWYVLCLIIGGALGCFTGAVLFGAAEREKEDEIEERVSREFYRAMINENLSPRTADRVLKRVKEKGGAI